jgi:hypothetical protein
VRGGRCEATAAAAAAALAAPPLTPLPARPMVLAKRGDDSRA